MSRFLIFFTLLSSILSTISFAQTPKVFQGGDEIAAPRNGGAPTLLKPEDVKRGGLEKRKKSNQSTFEFSLSQEELTRAILSSYSFFGDFEEEDFPATPPNWIKVSQNPFDALALGEPPRVERPQSTLELPLFRLTVLNHFSGSDASVFHLNTAVDFWRQATAVSKGAERTELLQAASNSFIEFERAVVGVGGNDEETAAKNGTLKKTSPSAAAKPSDAAVSAGWALRGYFYLHLLAEREKISGREEEGFTEKAVLSDKSLLSMTRASFQRALDPFPPQKLLPIFRGNSLDGSLLSTLFDCTYYEEDGSLTVPPPVGKECSLRLSDGIFAPERWLRTVAVSVYWNLVATQRIKGYWEKAFEAGDHLNAFSASIAESFKQRFRWPAYSGGLGPVVAPAQPVVASPVRLWPRRLADVEATGFLMQSYYSFLQNDPLEVIKAAARGIKESDTPELAALGFHLASLAYFDLNNFRRARQAAAWCESSSASFASKVPACIFIGAESAFWLGDLDVAERAFRRFLTLTGDSDYGPWAEYRILNIRHLHVIQARKVGPDAARREVEKTLFVDYDSLARRFPKHDVSNYAAVRSFCSGTSQGFLDGKALQSASAELRSRLNAFGAQVRSRAAARLKSEGVEGRKLSDEEIRRAMLPFESALERDAEACLLSSSLGLMYEKSGENRRLIKEESERQMAAIDEYRSRFSESPYLSLFAPRYRALNLAKVLDLADTNRCADLLTTYAKERETLNRLYDEGKLYLRTLFWGESEGKIVVRCAALHNDVALWREMRNMHIPRDCNGKKLKNAQPKGQDGGKLEGAFYAFATAKERRAPALRLADVLLEGLDASGWEAVIAGLDKGGNGFVRSDDFWRGMSLRALLAFELTGSPSEVATFRRQLLGQLLREPKVILKSDVLCLWTLRASSTFDKKMWDAVLAAQPADSWLGLIFEEKMKKEQECQKGLSGALLRASFDKPTAARDAALLLPYLERRGMREAGDEWLGYAQRLALTLGSGSRRVRALYQRLLREGPPLVQQSAKVWLENNGSAN